ncbi:uncharacterized protein TRAVEDRAFT_53589 [Trametes versicolor FP-101664 SS1]|uniref:uncharacterized protein n=1 Tax=Trametes versicolor (strain FP-101664) TaxID=717944 RepID=UPI0004622C9B|nr:uncharacterized protein TRAVEDRAFT_53589 [Trametes versicolor FP-101664 SS1]EIW52161.1 hypothetical protein TRAVEDRAFT_53589 [Trametes versicolor FP-101664 SS1]
MVVTLFDHLPIDSLVRFRSSSKAADFRIGSYMSRKLEAHLRRFVSNTHDFLHELEITCSVVSGSTALAVIFRLSWTPNDLDVYVPRDLFWHVIAYLVNVENYTVSFLDISDYVSKKIHNVGRLSREGGQIIDVIQSESNSPLLPLTTFWNTALMNYVTPNSFCVSYPHLTDAHHALIFEDGVASAGKARVPFPREPEELRRKYELRGFELHLSPLSWIRTADPSAQCTGIGSALCPLTMRYFGDRHCVTGSLYPLEGRKSKELRVDLLKVFTAVWWRGGQTCGDGCAAAGVWVEGSSYACSRSLLGE